MLHQLSREGSGHQRGLISLCHPWFESKSRNQIEEMWQSPVYCNSLENCRVERHREFESHRFRQVMLSVVATMEHRNTGQCRPCTGTGHEE